MIENSRADAAWRPYFLLILIATAVVFLIYLFRVFYFSRLSMLAVLRLKHPRQRRLDPTRSKISQILLRLDIQGFLWCSIATVCLQLAIYFGASQSWNTALVISLLTAGFGLSFAMFVLLQFCSPLTFSEQTAIPFRKLGSGSLIRALFTALWGFSYHSFSHITRKPNHSFVRCNLIMSSYLVPDDPKPRTAQSKHRIPPFSCNTPLQLYYGITTFYKTQKGGGR
jgi:hypothetical protein